MTDIAINKDQWDSVSAEEQQRITEALVETGAIQPGDRIVGDPSKPPFDENSQMEPMWNPIKDLCKAACDVAAGAALAWCAVNTTGIALAACIAAAEEGRKQCKRRC